jgi:hypothetical protein
MPKTTSTQAYFGKRTLFEVEDPGLSGIVLLSAVSTKGSKTQVVVAQETQRVGAIIDATGKKIKAGQVRTLVRRAFRVTRPKTAERKALAVRSRIEESVPEIAKHGSRFDSLLNSLRSGLDTPTKQAIDAVLEIQVTPIPEVDLEETVQLLVSFVKKHRETNSQKILIAVGAAIRKVLLNIRADQLGLAAELMQSSGSLEVPIEVELEVAKMVVHRFRYAPNTSVAGLTVLAELLLENAKVYSKANLVNREYYGATALNSVLSIVLMSHEEASALIHHIENNSPGWFVDLVKNRLRRMAKEIENEKLVGSVPLVDQMKSLGAKPSSSTGGQ